MNRPEPLQEPLPSRYVVGIDLGTTNSAVCYVDTTEPDWVVRPLAIEQLVAPGQTEARDTLPSFHYQPLSSEAGSKAWRLPWSTPPRDYAVGVLAREEGRLAPGRMIASAKSWLSHNGVDRTAQLLPWHPADDVRRLSPIEASSAYLLHVREAWDHRHPDFPLAEQDLVLTLPASFDEVARELTVKAAAEAGLSRVILIEEPQAAFYAWIYRHRKEWHQLVTPGQKILVCDVGGGTSDFTLIRVRAVTNDEASDAVQFHRIAVGEHLILGGDNLDLALAHAIEEQLSGKSLEPRQWDMLVRTCRQAKETLLGNDPPEKLNIHLPGSGSALIGGGLQIELRRDDVQRRLVDGFFPQVALTDRPRKHQSGFQEFGLPYAPDHAVTRYLAAFLTAHRHADVEFNSDEHVAHDPARPDLVLLNGGVFASPMIRERLLEVISHWFSSPDEAWQPTMLQHDRLDLAVARGAAYYGMVRRGDGVRIAAGLARSYYVEVAERDVASGSTAVCIVPGSAQAGETIDVPDLHFDLQVTEPVEFPLLVSSTRLTDKPGDLVAIDPEQMRPLAPLRTVLRTQRRNQRGTVGVYLQSHLSEIGTLELSVRQIEGDRSWRLQFDVRAATETDRVATETEGERQGLIDDATVSACLEVIDQTFGEQPTLKPNEVMKQLAVACQAERTEWPMTLLRRIWEALIAHDKGRRISQSHEARWLNLLGYSLRPGYGMAVDDWRVAETWRTVQGKLAFHSAQSRNESWILWRRVSGGLSSGQQQALAEPLIAALRALHRRMISSNVKGEAHFTIPEFAEVFRLLGSLEWLPVAVKRQLAEMLIDLLDKRKLEPVQPAMLWAIGRFGARVPVYGPLNTVLPADVVTAWIKELLAKNLDQQAQAFCIAMLARKTGDRFRDVPESLREDTLGWLEDVQANEHLRELVAEVSSLDHYEQSLMFGEALPHGLRIR